MDEGAIADTLGGFVEIPRGGLPSLSQLFLGNAPQPVPMALAAAGDVLWIVAYVLFIRAAFRDRTYGVPFVAICLNFTWELWFAVLDPPGDPVTHATHAGWFLLDCVILYQLLRHGRHEQRIPEIRRWFYPVVIATMAMALVGQVTLQEHIVSATFFPDTQGSILAWILNLVMAILFVFMYFDRRDLRGLSYAGAWSMTVGTTLVAIANLLLFAGAPVTEYELWIAPRGAGAPVSSMTVGTDTLNDWFFRFLYLSILLFNALYVALLTRARAARRAGAPAEPGAVDLPA